jgi:hypothetical protein
VVLERKICFVSQVNVPQSVLCVLASQIANYGESLIGATLQDKEGFEWVSSTSRWLIALFTSMFRVTPTKLGLPFVVLLFLLKVSLSYVQVGLPEVTLQVGLQGGRGSGKLASSFTCPDVRH